jgi:hypothetical protein
VADINVEDIWFKSQRVLRTIVQVGIPAFLGFALVLPQIISAAGLPVDGPLYGWLITAAGVITAVAAGLSRIMAIPAVNAWLTKIGLGSVPKSEAVSPDLSHLTVNGEPVSDNATLPEAPTDPADVSVPGDGLGVDQAPTK